MSNVSAMKNTRRPSRSKKTTIKTGFERRNRQDRRNNKRGEK